MLIRHLHDSEFIIDPKILQQRLCYAMPPLNNALPIKISGTLRNNLFTQP